MNWVFDTNILIDVLKDHREAVSLVGSDPGRTASIITWMELLVGCRTSAEEHLARELLNGFRLIGIVPAIAESAVMIRKERRIKLADSIILATARYAGTQLVTRNTRDFPPDDPEILVPYLA